MTTPLVLIVDNEIGLLGLFSSLVERLGYQVLRANDGFKALAILEEATPDLMILDLAMPKMSGLDVLREVITMPHLDQMRVMVLTAVGPGPAPDDVAHRIDAWVTRPIPLDAFTVLVQELVEGVA